MIARHSVCFARGYLILDALSSGITKQSLISAKNDVVIVKRFLAIAEHSSILAVSIL
jgi:hypothetical protein